MCFLFFKLTKTFFSLVIKAIINLFANLLSKLQIIFFVKTITS